MSIARRLGCALLVTSMVITPETAFASWKLVKSQVVPEDGVVESDDIGHGQPWEAAGYALATSDGNAGIGEGEIAALIASYSGPKLDMAMSAEAVGVHLREWKYEPTADHPVGEVEYKGKATAYLKVTIIREADAESVVLARIIAQADAVKEIATAELLHVFTPIKASKEEEDEESCDLFKCPANNFSLTKRASIYVSVGAHIGKGTDASGAEKVFQAGSAMLACIATNKDETLNLVSLGACP